MSKMQAFGWSQPGKRSLPRALVVDQPEPGQGQIKVKVAWSALNQADLIVSSGQFARRFLHAWTTPLILGYDFSGTVEGGPGMGDLKAGDEVFGFLPYAGTTRQGAFSEYVVVDRGAVARKPQGISHEIAAIAATPGLTALQFLRDLGRLKSGGRVLIIGAAGGVGSFAVSVAKRLGAHVTAVCSTYAVDHVRSLGADEVVDRRRQDPRTLNGRFDVIFDVSAAYSYAAFSKKLAQRGTFVSTLPTPGVFLGKILAPLAGKRCEFGGVKAVSSDLERLAGWLDSGLPAPVDAQFPVKKLGVALAHLGQGEVRGRIAVQVQGGF